MDSVTFSARADARWARMVQPGPPDQCWPWRGRTDAKGYGFLAMVLGGRRLTTRAHRVAWVRAHGEWPPPGQVVRHDCDTPACCNPGHLRLGTVRDNVQDCIRRGRRARGESLRQSRLTEDDVRAIRRRSAAGEHHTVIAPDYGVTRQAIRQVVNHITWRHVA